MTQDEHEAIFRALACIAKKGGVYGRSIPGK